MEYFDLRCQLLDDLTSKYMSNFDLYGGSRFEGVGRKKESQMDISNSDLMYLDVSEIIIII